MEEDCGGGQGLNWAVEPRRRVNYPNDTRLHFAGSEGSVQSWASSLSFDSQSDEMTAEAVEFMRKFVGDLFKDSSAIPLDQKSKFGQLVQVFYCIKYVITARSHNRLSIGSCYVRLESILENVVS
jgi:hypothetical protein